MKKAPVTEHALFRYIERVQGLDIEKAKQDMLTPEILTAINSGACGITQDGFTYLIEKKKIVTVIVGKRENLNHGRDFNEYGKDYR